MMLNVKEIIMIIEATLNTISIALPVGSMVPIQMQVLGP